MDQKQSEQSQVKKELESTSSVQEVAPIQEELIAGKELVDIVDIVKSSSFQDLSVEERGVVAEALIEKTATIVIREEMHTHMQFSGPLPPPEVLEKYKNLSPDILSTILKMASQEQSHRHAMDSGQHAILQVATDADVADRKRYRDLQGRGQTLGCGLTAFGLLASLFIVGFGIYRESNLGIFVGGMLGTATVVALGAMFLNNKSSLNTVNKFSNLNLFKPASKSQTESEKN